MPQLDIHRFRFIPVSIQYHCFDTFLQAMGIPQLLYQFSIAGYFHLAHEYTAILITHLCLLFLMIKNHLDYANKTQYYLNTVSLMLRYGSLNNIPNSWSSSGSIVAEMIISSLL